MDEEKTPQGSRPLSPEPTIDEEKIYQPTRLPTEQGLDNEADYALAPTLSSKSVHFPDVPNGGALAWIQVLSGFLLFFNSFGMVNAFGVFQDYYSAELLPTTSDSDISWIGSLQAFLVCCATIVAGPIFDRGHPRALAMAGSFLVVFGMMMTSLCTTYWQLMLAQALCVGFGGGCCFLTAVAIVPSYFTTKRALAIGIAASGSSLGGVILPIVFHRIQPHVGFPWATRVLGFISLATLILPCVCIKARAVPSKKKNLLDIAAFRELPFAIFCVASFLGFIGLYIPFFYISQFSATVADLGATVSFYMLPVLSAGSIAGRIVPGQLADKIGPLNVLGLCTMCAGILGFCWMALSHSLAGIVIWSLLYGASSGAFVSLQASVVVSITQDMSTVGGRLGINTFCSALGLLIGTPIGGVLLGDGSWIGIQAFTGATMLVASVLVMVTRVAKVGTALKVKA